MDKLLEQLVATQSPTIVLVCIVSWIVYKATREQQEKMRDYIDTRDKQWRDWLDKHAEKCTNAMQQVSDSLNEVQSELIAYRQQISTIGDILVAISRQVYGTDNLDRAKVERYEKERSLRQ